MSLINQLCQRLRPARLGFFSLAIALALFVLAATAETAQALVDKSLPLIRTESFMVKIKMPYGGLEQRPMTVFIQMSGNKAGNWACKRMPKIQAAIYKHLYNHPVEFIGRRMDLTEASGHLMDELNRRAKRRIFTAVAVIPKPMPGRAGSSEAGLNCLAMKSYPKAAVSQFERQIYRKRRGLR